jgi:phosphatidylglycerol---prolipoprotein diacylglyceryl transferase
VSFNIYAIMLGLGASVGCWQILRNIRPSERGRWSTFLLLVLLGALIGARAWYVLQTALLSAQWLPFFAIWQGGLGWLGAVLGFVLVTTIFVMAWEAPAAAIFDLLLPLYVLLPVMAWLGCWSEGCAYGARLPEDSFFGLRTLDEAGLVSERFPLQFLAVLLFLAIVSLILYLQHRSLFVFGQLTAAYGASLGFVLLLVAFLRADVQPRWQGLPVDVWEAIALLLVSVIAWFAAGVVYGKKKVEKE